MKPRYRICARCRHRWNVSRKAPSPHKYICPVCRKTKSAACESTSPTSGMSKENLRPLLGRK
ncbi:hypothetical protein OBV_43230 [Oscillibacter valericigenes Sjm18-20]|nr:hypothetical protein OBV_43230 [Oscillibacter valericigenes Sjm18-20]